MCIFKKYKDNRNIYEEKRPINDQKKEIETQAYKKLILNTLYDVLIKGTF